MYKVLCSEIQIGNSVFTRVAEVSIESSTQVLEDTAVIKIPTTARLKRDGTYTVVETAKYFKVGDEVVIKLGYDNQFREEFRGYVRKIKPNTPVEIECEDAVFLLRRKNLKKAFKNVTLKELLQYAVAGTGITLSEAIPDVKFDVFYYRDTSAAYALQKLKEEFGLLLYFIKPKVLHAGLAYDNDKIALKYVFGENIISQNLEWQEEEDVHIRIKAVHMRKNNTKTEKYYPSKDNHEGELKTIFVYNVSNDKDLELRAKQEALKYRYKGYKGDIETFLVPNANVGNVAVLNDPNYQERSGKYIIDKVTTTYSRSGARRKVELGLKV
jgi:hypothetical protein